MSMGIKLNNFVVQKSTGVYLPPGKKRTFDYADGAEDKILSIVTKINDRSADSMELELAIDDWPTKYHFSNLRTNILRALDLLKKDSTILEIGSGCGALTRYLGETFKSVDSIEGSFKRASITKERCKGLNNVRVYCSTLQDLSFDKQYDVVTLIGVLEYAPIYYYEVYKEKEDACLAMLKHAMSALKEDGILIIAIENKFGLKYWSGCTEDHTGRPFDSIHDYPKDNIAVTFSRNELKRLLEKAQLKYYDFYYPFPDYKLTNTILREVFDQASYYLHNWITVPFEDYSRHREYYFNEALAIKSLVKGGMIYELSNSFLIVAFMNQNKFKEEKDRRWVAKRFSTNRIHPFRTVTVLQHDADLDLLLIHKYKLFDAKEPEEFISLKTSDSKWIPGNLLQFSLYEAIYKDNGFESLLNIFRKYHNELIKKYFTGKMDSEGYPLVNLDAIDFLPCNIIINDDGMFSVDREWICTRPLSADYVLFRAVFLFTYEQYPFILYNLSIPSDNIDTWMISIMKVFYPRYDHRRHELNKKREEEFQSIVSGNIIKIPTPEEFRITKDPVFKQILQKQQILQKEAQINALLNSWSWKITRPLRWVYGKRISKILIILILIFPTSLFVLTFWTILMLVMMVSFVRGKD